MTDHFLAFNTGNGYSAHGQRIAAMHTLAGGYAFYDIDRSIQGYIPPEFVRDHYTPFVREAIYDVYLRQLCQYWVLPHDSNDLYLLLKAYAEVACPSLVKS